MKTNYLATLEYASTAFGTYSYAILMLSFYFVVSHVSMLWLMVLHISRMFNHFGFTD
jgi:hypothetical protein